MFGQVMSELRKSIFPWIVAHFSLFLLPLLSLLIYFPSLHHDFISDDRPLVVENPYIKSWKYLPEMLSRDAWNISEPTNYWRPVFSISLALDYSLWGLNPLGFHLTNILLHAINTVLLYLLGKRLQNSTSAGLFASLLFALHPIQAHTVNVISTRGDLLAAFFTLLSLQAFFSRKTIPFAIALILALLSKETSMVFPVAVLFAWIMIQREKQGLGVILGFVILGLYLMVRLSLGFSFSLIPLVFSYDASWETRWLLPFKVLALYFVAIWNLFEIPHPFWTVELPTSLNDPYVIGGILIAGLLVTALWFSFKKSPVATFGLAWFVIYFLPISNFKELNQSMAEHWLYVPMIGLSLAFGAAFSELYFRFAKVRPARAGFAAGVSVFLIFAVLVVREKTKIYQNDESFLIAAIRANPDIVRLYTLLGNTYVKKQEIPRAVELYTQALTLDPNDFQTNYYLGSVLYQVGEVDGAKIYLERIARTDPVLDGEVVPVAHAWEMLGDKRKALFYYRRALELFPNSTGIKQNIATLENAVSADER